MAACRCALNFRQASQVRNSHNADSAGASTARLKSAFGLLRSCLYKEDRRGHGDGRPGETHSQNQPGSPYHRVPIDFLTRDFRERPDQRLCFSSVGTGSGRFAPDAAFRIPPNRPCRRSTCSTPISHEPISVRYALLPSRQSLPEPVVLSRVWAPAAQLAGLVQSLVAAGQVTR